MLITNYQKQNFNTFVKKIYTCLIISLILITILTIIMFWIITNYCTLGFTEFITAVLFIPFILLTITTTVIRDFKKKWVPILSVILFSIELIISSILMAIMIYYFNIMFSKIGIAIVISVYIIVLGMFGITSYLGLHGNANFNAHQYAWKFFISGILATIVTIIFKFNWMTLIADALVIISAPFFMIDTTQNIKKDFHTAQFLKNDLPMVIDIADTMLLEIMFEFTSILHFLMEAKNDNDAN